MRPVPGSEWCPCECGDAWMNQNPPSVRRPHWAPAVGGCRPGMWAWWCHSFQPLMRCGNPFCLFVFSCEMFQLLKHCVSQTKHAYRATSGPRAASVWRLLCVPTTTAAQPRRLEEGKGYLFLTPEAGVNLAGWLPKGRGSGLTVDLWEVMCGLGLLCQKAKVCCNPTCFWVWVLLRQHMRWGPAGPRWSSRWWGSTPGWLWHSDTEGEHCQLFFNDDYYDDLLLHKHRNNI